MVKNNTPQTTLPSNLDVSGTELPPVGKDQIFVPFTQTHQQQNLSEKDTLKTLQKGIDLQKQGKLTEAEYWYQLVLRHDSKNPDALNLMGVLAADGKLFDISIHFLEQAILYRHEDPIILNNLANAYIMSEAPKMAVPLLKKALKHSKEHHEINLNLARAYRNSGFATKSISEYKKILKQKPDYIPACIGMGVALTDSGETEKAVKTFKDVIQKKPQSAMAYYGLSKAQKFKDGDPIIDKIEILLNNQTLDNEEREYLHYAAGKIYDDIKSYDHAFDHYKKAKSIIDTGYNIDVFRKEVDNIIHLFDKKFFETYKNFGDPDTRPIFIVGMPRSGTTLTEQILSSHPDIYGAGELSTISMLREKILPLLKQKKQSSALTPKKTTFFSKEYFKDLKNLAGNASRITDKMPHNFISLGIIYLLFPNAHIIHCQRNPMDTCLSCFTNKFNQKHGYNENLKTLGLYYQEYKRLMKHWHDVLPSQIFTVQYEDLIQNQKAMSKKLLEFVDMPWHDNCLYFYQSKRDVSTLSNWQVRQPIYSSSIKRWKNYDKYLGDLKEIFY